MLVQIRDGSLSLGGKVILSHIDFEIKGKEKLALVGKNGAGKTTLLRLLADLIAPDKAGDHEPLSLDLDDKREGPGFFCSRKLTMGMLKQTFLPEELEKTVAQFIQDLLQDEESIQKGSREEGLFEGQFNKLLTGMGFSLDIRDKKLNQFSGGEQTKLHLIGLLLKEPDLLLLDEPTNHLDIETTEWLEDYLIHYDKAVLFVSHDRFFTDRVAGRVCELSAGKVTSYPGNYTGYRKEKRERQRILQKKYEEQQEEIRRLDELINRFRHKPRKASFIQSRKKILERMEKMEKPQLEESAPFTGKLDPLVTGSKWVYEAEHLKIGYENKSLLELSLRVRRGQKIGIIGANGVGKTTFLKTAAGLLPPIDGKQRLGNQILMGYFDQNTAAFQSGKSVREHFGELFPALTEKELRQALASYLFKGAMLAEKTDHLSGGEKARLILAEMLQSQPNLMMLDEPTNHMDIPAKERLEEAFMAYSGTLLFITHDRYFLNRIADALLVFEKDKVLYYPFGYEHYLEKKKKALISSEDQLLISSLKAVPKKERMQSRTPGTEEAYAEWKLNLAGEDMKRQEECFEDYYNALAELEEKEWLALASGESIETDDWRQKKEEIKRNLETAEKAWTKTCIEWLMSLDKDG